MKRVSSSFLAARLSPGRSRLARRRRAGSIGSAACTLVRVARRIMPHFTTSCGGKASSRGKTLQSTSVVMACALTSFPNTPRSSFERRWMPSFVPGNRQFASFSR